MLKYRVVAVEKTEKIVWVLEDDGVGGEGKL